MDLRNDYFVILNLLSFLPEQLSICWTQDKNKISRIAIATLEHKLVFMAVILE